eukprot:GHRR01030363.1.p1 GENE.GHRR01030363.1~~GHRR01030363.1.p1  ORF type:complete len:315 (+),score=152.41 GHRR01030363.1:121-1065(+)
MGFISPLKALQAASRTIVPCRYAPGSSRRETLFAATIVIAAGVVQPAEAAVPDHILHIQQPHENQIIDPSHAVYASAETAAAARQGASSAAAANSNCSKLDPVLASAFVAAVDKVVQQQGILPEEQLQRERYKLQQQEYKYYLAANKERMPQLPELADNSGGLSNRLYFNFVSYILWKVVAKNLGPDSEKRTAFCAAVGEALLVDMLPDIVKLVTAAAQGDAHQAPAAVLIPALRDVLNHLQQHGYLCSYQLVWDSQPGSWPADWAVSQQQVVGPEQLLEQQAPLAQGTIFQVGSRGVFAQQLSSPECMQVTAQ